jgi:ATP-dependent DNA helicase PIF1
MSQNGGQPDIYSSFGNMFKPVLKRKIDNDCPTDDDSIINDNLNQPNKILKTDSTTSFADFGNNSKIETFQETLVNLKSLFNSLKTKHKDHEEIFDSLLETLNKASSKLKPASIITSKYFDQNNVSDGVSPLNANVPKTVSFGETRKTSFLQVSPITTQKQPSSSIIPSSPIKNEVKSSVAQSRHLHLATQANLNVPVHRMAHEPKHVKTITLSSEQEMVIELARLGKNIFYTGSAGTGKSLLLKTLIKNLKQQHPPESVCVTASTGLAAYNIGGMTINSCTGIGLGTGTADYLVKKITSNKKAKARWDAMKVLIIDEISMIDGTLIDKLDEIAKRLKIKHLPFGGIQVIFCGDFYQLPPVSKDKEIVFAFESKFWRNNIKVQVLLKQVFRQASDKQFLQMLQEIRDGKVSESTIKKFKSLERPLPRMDNLIPTKLFSTRKEVDIANNRMLKQLDGEGLTYTAIDSGTLINTPQAPKMLENFLAPKSITLKPGAQVMMVKNIDETLVNGSLGTVIGFTDPGIYKVYQNLCTSLEDTNESNVLARLQNIACEPSNNFEDTIFDFLRNVTIGDEEIDNQRHELNLLDKNTQDPSIVELNSELTANSDYHADSTQPIDPTDRILRDPIAQSIQSKAQLLAALSTSSTTRKLPLVCFRLSNGESRTIAVEEEIFTVEDNDKHVLLQREQLPLMLAWALSIHKSQGQTLKYVSVDLKRIFEDGQAYVALSRAEHRRGLQVLNFEAKKISTNSKVIQFYKNLSDAKTVLDNLNNNSNKNKSQNNSDTSFSDLDYRRTIGINTQIKNLPKCVASPERFYKYSKPKQNGIDQLMKNMANSQQIGEKDVKEKEKEKEREIDTEKENINIEARISEKVRCSKLSSDIFKSDDDDEAFQDLFNG